MEQEVLYSETKENKKPLLSFLVLLFFLFFIFPHKTFYQEHQHTISFYLIFFIVPILFGHLGFSVQIRPTEIRMTLRSLNRFDLITLRSIPYNDIAHIDVIKSYETQKGIKIKTKSQKRFYIPLNPYSNADELLHQLSLKFLFDPFSKALPKSEDWGQRPYFRVFAPILLLGIVVAITLLIILN